MFELRLSDYLCVILLLAILGGFLMGKAWGQDIHHHEGQSEAVDLFYSTWTRPPNRTVSCCNRLDCYQTTVKRLGNVTLARQRETGEYIQIPEDRIEQNYYDARVSPDGHAHLCADVLGNVFCFTYGDPES